MAQAQTNGRPGRRSGQDAEPTVIAPPKPGEGLRMGGVEHLIGRLLRPVRAGEKHLACNDPAARDAPEAITLSSPAFASSGAMPQRYAGQGVGDNVSPPLEWLGVPAAAQELVLIVEDASVPLPRPLVHVLVRGIAPNATGLPEGALSDRALLTQAALALGRNSLRRAEYAGPRPIPGHGPHTYVFQLFALDRRLALGPPFGRAQLLAAMSGHVIARGRLDGIYQR
jgi:Raf kinase inhibitor-like YbhB/YbcL family protein